MNNEPVGTPNPLNPKPTVDGGADTSSRQNFTKPTQPFAPKATNRFTAPRPVERNSASATAPQQQIPPQDMPQSRMVESLDPTGRKMEQVPNVEEEPKKKKKTGLVVGIIIGILVLCGAAAFAWWWISANSFNPVEKAVAKILNDEVPAYTTVKGQVVLEPTALEQDSAVDKIKVDYVANIDSSTLFAQNPALSGDMNANLTISGKSFDDISVSVNGIYSKDGNFYLKLDGVLDIIESTLLSAIPNSVVAGDETLDCVEDASGSIATDCASASEVSALISSFENIFANVEGVWLKLSAEELQDVASNAESYNNIVGCIVNLSGNSTANSTLLDAYKQNRFLTVSTQDAPTTKNANTLYRIGINGQRLANYLNAINNTDLMYEVYSCLNVSNTRTIDAKDVDNVLGQLPATYVEVDNNDRFSRVYMDAEIEDASTHATIDTSFEYPNSLNVAEPKDAKVLNLTDAIQGIINSLYSADALTGSDVAPYDTQF